ncbi:hypothetical protein [Methylocystis echinoides]|jgi:hypothetical protein|uniref:hypothetical protein n=1 Tax=Methylocystis echinoides TaxID=29468 RepID=UPI0034173DCC
MMKLAQCAAQSGIASDGGEGCAPASRLLSSYLLNIHRGREVVREMLDRDRHCFLELGAKSRAAELETALRLFVTRYPQAG